MGSRLRAVAHSDRLRIMHRMRDGKERTPVALALEFDADIAQISYHIRLMADRGVLELTRIEPVRGAVRHWYALSSEGAEIRDWLKL